MASGSSRRRRLDVRRTAERIEISAQEIQRFFATDAGRRLRRMLAAGLILTAPLLFRTPMLRRHPLLRWVEIVGGAALVVRLAESLRDWEPDRPTPIVLDIEGDVRDRS
jgi:hypothetical protein